MPKFRGGRNSGRTARILAACTGSIRGKSNSITSHEDHKHEAPLILNNANISNEISDVIIQEVKLSEKNVYVSLQENKENIENSLSLDLVTTYVSSDGDQVNTMEENKRDMVEKFLMSQNVIQEFTTNANNGVEQITNQEVENLPSLIASRVCEDIVPNGLSESEGAVLIDFLQEIRSTEDLLLSNGLSTETVFENPLVFTSGETAQKENIYEHEQVRSPNAMTPDDVTLKVFKVNSPEKEDRDNNSDGSKIQNIPSMQEVSSILEEDNVENDPDYVPTDDEICEDETNDRDAKLSLDEHNGVDGDDIKAFSNKNIRKRKRNRNSGKEYRTAKGKIIKQREMKPLANNCRNKCKNKLDEETRQKIFNEYWGLATYNPRVAFVASLITVTGTKITRTKIDDRPIKNRLHTYIYNFEINGNRIVVCKRCFLATLDESEKFITCTISNKLSSSSGVTYTDRRGTHVPVHKTAQYKIDEVAKHINSFPAYESHYSRRHTDKKYLASNLNLNTMYSLYREKHKDKPVSIKIYAREFHKMNLKFKKPKNDTCSKCDTLLAKEKYSNEDEEKNKIRRELDSHLAAADLAYLAKDIDKKNGKDDPSHVTYAFDLQQVLQTPYFSTNKMFYLRQLATYNLTIHDCNSGSSSHFMWPECTAGRGANEVASCLFRHIMDIPNGVKVAVFYSDTCGGQNKNSFVCSMFQYAIQRHETLEIIDHKFLVPGHTHLECDVDHAVIERAKKKYPFDIHVPRDWYQLVRNASKKNKFKVAVMEQEHFFSFADLITKGPLQNKNKTFKLREVCWLRYTKDSVVRYKCSLKEEQAFKEVSFFKKGQKLLNLQNYQLLPLYNTPRPISVKKKENLLDIVNLLDKSVQEFYYNLPVDKKLEKDTDPDVDRYLSEDED